MWPKGFDTIYTLSIALGYLKSNISDIHEVVIVDCALMHISAKSDAFRKILIETNPDLIGVSTWSPMFWEAISVLKAAKALNSKVITVIGGAHSTSYPEKSMENECIDFLFRGEAELSFPLFVDELEKSEPILVDIPGLTFRSATGKLI